MGDRAGALCQHLDMTGDEPVSGVQRGVATAALVAMAGGLVLAIGSVASLPSSVESAGAAVFLGGVLAFGVIAYRDALSNGSSFASALRRSLRTAVKVLFALMP
jgi:hypothetical protein